MANSRLIRNAANKKAGMTLRELEDFVANAKILNIPEDTSVKVLCGVKLQLQTLETR